MSNSQGKKDEKDESNKGKESSSSNKKRALKQERQSSKKHYTDVTRMKELWNKLRRKDNDKKSTEKMMDELISLLEGKVKDVSMQHDASRVVQAAIQFGSTSQRTMLLNELAPAIPELAKVQYAHFVVLKLITYCGGSDKAVSKTKGKKRGKDEGAEEVVLVEMERQRHTIIKAFKGEMPKLAIHAVGARCVELMFGTFPAKETTPLRYELYGPHFVFHLAGSYQLGDATVTMRHISLMTFLSEHREKRDQVLKFVASLLTKGGEKSLYSFAYFQKLYWEYIQSLLLKPGEDNTEKLSGGEKGSDHDKLIQEGKEKIQKEVAPFVSDHAIQMISSRAGTRVLCECAAYGTPKDRRKILKSLKGYTRSSLLHRDAYLLILRMLDITDDTVTVNKLLLRELINSPNQDEGGGDESAESTLLELALDNNACKFFLRLLAPENMSYLDPSEVEILKPPTMLDSEGNVVATYKKEPSMRQKELLGYLKSSMEELSLKHTSELMKSKSGSKFLREFLLSFPSTQLANNILDATEQDISEDEDVSKSMFEDPVAHILLKNIILFEADESSLATRETNQKANKCIRERIEAYQQVGMSFANILFERYKGHLLEKIGFCNRGAFVLEALCRIKSIGNHIKEELAAESSKIADLGEKQMGFQCLAKVLTKSEE